MSVKPDWTITWIIITVVVTALLTMVGYWRYVARSLEPLQLWWYHMLRYASVGTRLTLTRFTTADYHHSIQMGLVKPSWLSTPDYLSVHISGPTFHPQTFPTLYVKEHLTSLHRDIRLRYNLALHVFDSLHDDIDDGHVFFISRNDFESQCAFPVGQ